MQSIIYIDPIIDRYADDIVIAAQNINLLDYVKNLIQQIIRQADLVLSNNKSQ